MTSQKIIVTRREGLRLTAVWEDNRVVEWIAEEEEPEIRIGDIFLAQVKNLVKNVNAAFLEIRPGIPGFLPLGEKRNSLQPGMLIPVVINREGTDSKAVLASEYLSLTGRFLVLTTDREQVAVSSKIRSTDRREELKHLLESRSVEWHMGFILRTNAEHAAAEQILAEADSLHARLEEIQHASEHRTAFSRLYSGGRAYEGVIRDARAGVSTEVITDQKDICDELLLTPYFLPGGDLTLRFYDDTYPMDKCYRLEHFLEMALNRRVWLKSGGYLVIDYTEALTVIDVNSGKYDGHKKKEEAFHKINREACEEIGYQLRLRNLSGIILVDFIDTDDEKRAELGEELKRILMRDPRKAVLVDITKLHLAEITRKKVRRPLWQQLKKTLNLQHFPLDETDG